MKKIITFILNFILIYFLVKTGRYDLLGWLLVIELFLAFIIGFIQGVFQRLAGR